jgi:hypothetical protein
MPRRSPPSDVLLMHSLVQNREAQIRVSFIILYRVMAEKTFLGSRPWSFFRRWQVPVHKAWIGKAPI